MQYNCTLSYSLLHVGRGLVSEVSCALSFSTSTNIRQQKCCILKIQALIDFPIVKCERKLNICVAALWHLFTVQCVHHTSPQLQRNDEKRVMHGEGKSKHVFCSVIFTGWPLCLWFWDYISSHTYHTTRWVLYIRLEISIRNFIHYFH